MTKPLVIVRHYEPLSTPEETSELLHCVYERLFDADLLEHLTQTWTEGTIVPGDNGKGNGYESSKFNENPN